MGEQGAFLSAYTAPDLHNDAFFVIGVLGQQQDLELPVKRLLFLFGACEGLLAQLLHFGVRHELLGLLHFLNRPIVGTVGIHDGL